jgi:hypothetical protein
MENIPNFGHTAFHPISLIWNMDYGPSVWGNSTPWRDILRDDKYRIPEGEVNGIRPSTVYYYFDTWIVFSVGQRTYWNNQSVSTAMDTIK